MYTRASLNALSVTLGEAAGQHNSAIVVLAEISARRHTGFSSELYGESSHAAVCHSLEKSMEWWAIAVRLAQSKQRTVVCHICACHAGSQRWLRVLRCPQRHDRTAARLVRSIFAHRLLAMSSASRPITTSGSHGKPLFTCMILQLCLTWAHGARCNNSYQAHGINGIALPAAHLRFRAPRTRDAGKAGWRLIRMQCSYRTSQAASPATAAVMPNDVP